MIHANFVVLRKTGDDGDLPLANFHQASFDNCKVGGDFIDQRQPDAFQMVNGSGVVRATPGELDDTGDFTVTWKHR
jgi:hypothetical protein